MLASALFQISRECYFGGVQSRLSRFIFSVALLLFAQSILSKTSLAQETGQLIRTEYVASKDLTQVTLNPIILASKKFEELRMGAITGYPGKVKSKPKEVGLVFFSLSKSDENRYEAAHKLTVVADEKRFDWGETQRTKQAQNGLFVETMTASVPFDDFLFVIKAKQVKIKLGLTEVELGEPQLNALKLLVSYVSE